MVKIITYEKPIDFLNANREFINSDYFAHYHLISRVEGLLDGEVELYECFNVVDNKGSNILVIWFTIGWYFYSNSWTAEMIKVLADKVQLHKFKHTGFCGTSKLVKHLFEESKINGEIFKNRFIEVCNAVPPRSTLLSGQAENGSFDDLEELVAMAVDYNLEEFQGKGSHTKDSLSASVMNSIMNKSIYIWRAGKTITSIVQRINDDEEYALIGSLYTKPEFRGNGYAYSLLHTVTDGLLNAGYKKCGLISDADNTVTTKLFQKINYTRIYEWVLIRKED